MSSRSLKWNVLANFLGKGLTAVIGIVFVPVYVHLIGIESIGIIGLFASFQVALGILDMGLSATLNRELARAAATSADPQDSRDLLRTLEWIYWAMSVLIALLLGALAPFLAHHWVQAKTLDADTLTKAGMMMAVQMAVQFPQSLYNGGLMGLERQVLLNGITSATNLAKHAGVLLPLCLWRADVFTFVGWQTLISIASIAATRMALWKSLPMGARKAQFDVVKLKRVARFTIGISATALVSLPLTLTDKLVLSHVLLLDDYGYYMLAFQGAGALGILVGPFFAAYLPRLSGLAALKEEARLNETYAGSCQLLASVLAPAAASAMLFAVPLIGGWLHGQSSEVVAKVAPLFMLLIAGNYCNGLMNLPYGLTLARGWTSYGFAQNALASLVYLPLLFCVAPSSGATGAAMCWLVINAGSLVLGAPYLHRRMVPGQFWRWAIHGVATPAAIAAIVLLAGRYLVPATSSAVTQIMMSSLFAGFATIFLTFILPKPRQLILNFLRPFLTERV